MVDLDSVVIAEERFAQFWADSALLRAEHEAEVGPRDGVTLDPNVDLMARLEEIGMLLIMTVRSNGRMFGYLGTIIGPSLESTSLLVGTQTGFFVSRDFRGVGPRLQRASIEALRARGVGEVQLRAGVRGSGPKLGALYRRLGAVEYGELFSLVMEPV